MSMYTIKKSGSMYQVISLGGMVQFQSLKRANCVDWIKANTPRA